MATVSVTGAELLDTLQKFICELTGIPSGNVQAGQQNRKSMPKGDFIIMTPMATDSMSTNAVAYRFNPQSNVSEEVHTRTSVWRCQLDFYGPSAQENARIIATLYRSDYSCEWFRRNKAEKGLALLSPLYSTDPHQTTMINGEQQYENRWTCDIQTQIPSDIIVPQQFMTNASVTANLIDANYPPENV